MTKKLVAQRAGASLVAASFFAPAIASASYARTAFVTWQAGPIQIRAAVGTETDISFGPNEQITYAAVDDGARWDAHEAAPLTLPGDVVTQRVGVTPSEPSSTMMTVRTNERTYKIKLVGVAGDAPSQVAFTYRREFISRPVVTRTAAPVDVASGSGTFTVAAKAPAVAIATPTAAPAATAAAAIAAGAPIARPQLAVSPLNDGIPREATGSTLEGAPPLVEPRHLVRADNCPPVDLAQTKALGALTLASQVVDSGVASAAVRHGALKSVVFGPHGFLFYLGASLLEDKILAHVTRRWCAADQNKAALGLFGANVFNAIHSGVKP